MSDHNIIGSEAFDRDRMAPAHGSMQTYGRPRRTFLHRLGEAVAWIVVVGVLGVAAVAFQ